MRNIEIDNNKEKETLKGKEKIDSWIDDIIKQHKKRKGLLINFNKVF